MTKPSDAALAIRRAIRARGWTDQYAIERANEDPIGPAMPGNRLSKWLGGGVGGAEPSGEPTISQGIAFAHVLGLTLTELFEGEGLAAKPVDAWRQELDAVLGAIHRIVHRLDESVTVIEAEKAAVLAAKQEAETLEHERVKLPRTAAKVGRPKSRRA